MSVSHIVLLFGQKTISIGRAGDPKPLGTHCLADEITWDEYSLFRLLYRWFHDLLLTSPKHAKLIVLENILLPLQCKETLCRVGLKRLGLQSMSFIPDVLMTCVGGGVRNGIVIDIGSEHTIIVPIVDLRIMDNYLGISKRGSTYIHKKLKDILPNISDRAFTSLVLSKAMKGQVLTDEEQMLIDTIDAQLTGGVDESSFDLDELPITLLLSKTVAKLPMDVKNMVSSHLMLSGTLCEFEGFSQRIVSVLGTRFVPIKTLGPWAGGSLYSSNQLKTNIPNPMEITPEMIAENCPLPDWQLKKFYT